jgi:uncharacterized protein YndB with AHSA1/START domain
MPIDQLAAAVAAEPLRLELSRRIAAPRDKVFGLWTTPAHLERFICPGNTGASVQADVRVGGRFHIDMFGPKGQVWPHDGEYLEVDAPRRLRFTWISQASPAELNSIVTVDFEDDSGGTLVTLVQERFANPKEQAGHTEGWTMILNQLEAMHA